MTRALAMRLASLAFAAGALVGSACDRVVNLTPAQDAQVLNDGEPLPDAQPPDTEPPTDALEVDAFVIAPDAGVDGAIDGAAAAPQPTR